MNWLAIPLAYLRHAFPCCAALQGDLCPLGYALGPKGGRLLSVTEQEGDAFVAQRRENCYIIAIKIAANSWWAVDRFRYEKPARGVRASLGMKDYFTTNF